MINTDQFTDLVNCTRLSWIVIPTNQAVGIEKPYRKEAFLSLGFSLRFLFINFSFCIQKRIMNHVLFKKKKKHKNNDCCFRSRMFRGFWIAGAVCISHTPMPDLLRPVFKCFIPLSGLSFLLLVIWSKNKWWYLWPAELFLKNNKINIKVKYTSKNNTLSTAPAFTLDTDRIQHPCSRAWPLGERMGWNELTCSDYCWLTEKHLLLIIPMSLWSLYSEKTFII